jgi:hypothetical protein
MLALVTALLAACGDSDVEPPMASIGAAAYSAALEEQLPSPAPDGDPRPVVFVLSIGDEPLSLEDQVAIVDEHAETHDIRFVDELDAAIDVGVDDQPVRDDGVLVGLGTIPAERPHVVRVETYRTDRQVTAQLVTLAVSADTWRVVGSEVVDPEVFVAVG